jgi:hypothetical protein
MKGIFVSLWDGNVEIRTPAVLNINTGEITTESVNVDNVEILEREFFESENGDMFEVCPECHSHILKVVMKNGIGKTLNEVQVCTDPECSNK